MACHSAGSENVFGHNHNAYWRQHQLILKQSYPDPLWRSQRDPLHKRPKFSKIAGETDIILRSFSARRSRSVILPAC